MDNSGTQDVKFTQTLENVVAKVMRQMRLPEDDEDRLYDYAEDFLRDLNNDTFHKIKVYEGKINPNKTITFPPDFIDWMKMGYQVGSQIAPLGRSENLALNGKVVSVPTVMDTIAIPFPWPASNYPDSPMFVPRTYIPTWQIDYSARQIKLDPMVKIPNFYMEYLADCIDVSCGILVHPFFQTALMAHMMFWISCHTPSRKGEVGLYQQRLDDEISKMRQRVAPSAQEIISDFRRVMY
jgi:hypothetical protein